MTTGNRRRLEISDDQPMIRGADRSDNNEKMVKDRGDRGLFLDHLYF